MSELVRGGDKVHEDRTRKAQKQWAACIIVVLAMLGVAAQLFASKWGAGLNPDSTAYIGAARNLLSGHGLGQLSDSGELIPLTHYPPLFSLLLAAIGVFGIDPLDGARWVNAILFGANILFVGFVIRRYTRGSLWASAFGSILVLACFVTLKIHFMAWSEPLFLLFGMLGLLLLADHIDSPTPLRLVASGSLVALAFLTRYLGITLVVTGVLAILLSGRRTAPERVRDAVVFGMIGSLPTALWLLRNQLVAGSSTHREISFHPVTLGHVKAGLSHVAKWILPDVPGQTAMVIRGIILVTIVGGLLILLILQFRGKGGTENHDSGPEYFETYPLVLLGLIIVYPLLVAVSISFFDYATGFGPRILSPVYVSAVIVVVSAAYRLLSPMKGKLVCLALCLALSVAIGGFYLQHGVRWVNEVHILGWGYASKTWTESEIIQSVKALPSEVRVYTNGPDAIYILTGKPASWIPSKIDPARWVENTDYPSQLALMGEDLSSQRAVLVYFDTITWRRYLPSKQEIREQLPLRVLAEGTDGSIYEYALEE